MSDVECPDWLLMYTTYLLLESIYIFITASEWDCTFPVCSESVLSKWGRVDCVQGWCAMHTHIW